MQRKAPPLSLPEFLARFSTDRACRRHLEKVRWPEGRICPHCGGLRSWPITGRGVRAGLYECAACSKQFTVTVGSVFEDSKIPLPKWFLAIFLMLDSRKGISSNQLSRVLGVTYKTAWFMTHRIRHMMEEHESLAYALRGTVEVDETYVGGKPRRHSGPHKRGRGTKKVPVMVLVERDGIARNRVIEKVNASTLKGAIRESVHPSARIMTDEWRAYRGLHKEFAQHGVVNHGRGEYKNGDASTNTAEAYFALLKRGVYGTFHHVSKRHLPRYLHEFNFRWNTRRDPRLGSVGEVLNGSIGRRLTYRETTSRKTRKIRKGRKKTRQAAA